MKMGDALLKKLNKKYEPATMVSLKFRDYDLAMKTDDDGNPILLFIGKIGDDGMIKGDRYARRGERGARMHADAGVAQAVELVRVREHAVRERRELPARGVLRADDRALARRARALDVLDHDAAPRQVGAESHCADGIDDRRLRAIDGFPGYVVVTKPDGEFCEGASGRCGHGGRESEGCAC